MSWLKALKKFIRGFKMHKHIPGFDKSILI